MPYIADYLLPDHHHIRLEGDYDADPSGIDYSKGFGGVGLNSKYDRLLGLRVQKCFILPSHFADKLDNLAVETELTDKLRLGDLTVVKEIYQYDVDLASGLPTRQGKHIYFAHLDGSFDSEPNKEIPGSIVEATSAENILIGRRRDLISYLKGRAAQLNLRDETQPGSPLITDEFFKQYFNLTNEYEKFGNPSIIQTVMTNTEQSWLDIQVPLDKGLAALQGIPYDPQNPPTTEIRNAIAGAMEAALTFPTQVQIDNYLATI